MKLDQVAEPCVLTATWKRVSLIDPSPDDICIVDIAVALSRMTLWLGPYWYDGFYSVAEHSLRMSKEPSLADFSLWGLLSRAPTAYMVSAPKRSPIEGPGSFDFAISYDLLERAIAKAFDLPWPISIEQRDLLQEADQAVQLRVRDLLLRIPATPRGPFPRSLYLCFSPAEVQQRFLTTFTDLMDRRTR